MSALRPGLSPVITSCAIAALVAGCSSAGSTAKYTATDAAVVQRMAQATVVEDDGLPAQTPPRAEKNRIPVDPNEPFSPDYGGANPAALPASPEPERAEAAAPARPTPALPADLPPAFRSRLVTALRDTD